ncbi:fibrillarin-like rRNA/tRNA 2'-O-methyltransferase [Candidatus Woesearchaeota archaeon]|nr:fibrillarin-like rRNA/tRNA 2'-O-methyltransferase [Candidatus Woesearchaeota archaeon]
MIKPSRLQGIFEMQRGKFRNLLTRNLVPGRQVYGERLFHIDGIEYREWDPESSKICAALHNGLSQIGLKPGDVALYLGCSTGTTVSHVSDLVGEAGFVFAVDLAPRVLRELIFIVEDRHNLAPILCDANRVDLLAKFVCQVDWLFQDIAQRDQVGIFQKNVNTFLKPGGFGVLAIKARSINVARAPKQIFLDVRRELEKSFTIVDYRELDPFQKDHALFVVKKALMAPLINVSEPKAQQFKASGIRGPTYPPTINLLRTTGP